MLSYRAQPVFKDSVLEVKMHTELKSKMLQREVNGKIQWDVQFDT